MIARVSRNVGSYGAREWRADPPQKHGHVLVYARVMLLEGVTFVSSNDTKHDGWAVGELVSVSDPTHWKGPKFAITEPEIYGLENDRIEMLPEEGWEEFRFLRGTGFVTPAQRVLRAARLVLLAPALAVALDPILDG